MAARDRPARQFILQNSSRDSLAITLETRVRVRSRVRVRERVPNIICTYGLPVESSMMYSSFISAQ